MSAPVLTLKDYGVTNGDKVILDSATLEFAEKGIINILGPAAVGKSALIRTLSGLNSSHPGIRTSGEASYLGKPIGEAGYPATVVQNANLMKSSIFENILSDLPGINEQKGTRLREIACDFLENAKLGELTDNLDMCTIDLPLETIRHLAIARVCAANPGLVFIDEPTRKLDNDRARKLLEYIKAESENRAVAIVTKNKALARLMGGRSLLLDGGQVQEDALTEELFTSPKSIAGKEFIGNAAYKKSLSLVDTKNNKNENFSPQRFILLKKGEIAALSQSDITADLEQDLHVLQKSGVTHLISLSSEADLIEPGLLAKYRISSIYEPIEDRGVPTIERASYICEEVGHLVGKGNVVALHCLADPGRTGIILALHLIWEGKTAQQAIDEVRKINPEWAQTEGQMLFLAEFANETTTKY